LVRRSGSFGPRATFINPAATLSGFKKNRERARGFSM